MKWIQLGDWSNIGDGDERNRMVLKSQAYMIKWIVMPFTEKKKRGRAGLGERNHEVGFTMRVGGVFRNSKRY